MSMQYAKIVSALKSENTSVNIYICFYYIDKDINCGYSYNRLSEMLLTSTNNLCFGSKMVYPIMLQFLYIKLMFNLGCHGHGFFPGGLFVCLFLLTSVDKCSQGNVKTYTCACK